VGRATTAGLGFRRSRELTPDGVPTWRSLKLGFTSVTARVGVKGAEVTPISSAGRLSLHRWDAAGLAARFMAALGFVAVFCGARTPARLTIMGIDLFARRACAPYLLRERVLRGICPGRAPAALPVAVVDTPKSDDPHVDAEAPLRDVRKRPRSDIPKSSEFSRDGVDDLVSPSSRLLWRGKDPGVRGTESHAVQMSFARVPDVAASSMSPSPPTPLPRKAGGRGSNSTRPPMMGRASRIEHFSRRSL